MPEVAVVVAAGQGAAGAPAEGGVAGAMTAGNRAVALPGAVTGPLTRHHSIPLRSRDSVPVFSFCSHPDESLGQPP